MALMILLALGSSGPAGGRESHKWEPTQSAAHRLNSTQSECSPRSRAPRSTQSDDDRHPKQPWTSLTRKRSLVQIQYGPRHFSKLCLVAGTQMGASHLRIYRLPAGQYDVPDTVLARVSPGNVGQTQGSTDRRRQASGTQATFQSPCTAARRLVHRYSAAPTQHGFPVLERLPRVPGCHGGRAAAYPGYRVNTPNDYRHKRAADAVMWSRADHPALRGPGLTPDRPTAALEAALHRRPDVIYREYCASRYYRARYPGRKPHRSRASLGFDSIDLPQRYRWIYGTLEGPPYPRYQNSGLFHYEWSPLLDPCQ